MFAADAPDLLAAPAWRAVLGAVSALGALWLYVALLAALRGDEAKRGGTAWFGYARDAANLVGGGSLMLAFVVVGLPAPQALLVGALLGLVAYCLDWAASRRLRLRG